jgi:hypothetical protein
VGRAAFDAAMMVALVLYAYAIGERASRRIEQRCREDIAAAPARAGLPTSASCAASAFTASTHTRNARSPARPVLRPIANRQHMIEPIFAQTKITRRADRFQRRGLPACRS